MDLKQALSSTGKFTANEIASIGRAFETVGAIAVLEFGNDISNVKKKAAGSMLLSIHKNIKTVLEKTADVSGKYRVPKYKFLAGEKTTIAMHKENGCFFRVDLAKAYFSSKLSSERLRIAELVKDGENVLVLFAGVGPFAIVFAKHSNARKIVGIELNPAACKNFRENIKLNKVGENVECVQGDVNKVVRAKPEKFSGKFDRVAMPLPKGAEDFLETAIKA